ncbi:MAG: Na/Pi cotransporter family protein [Bacillota bacterium]|nr:Na/Pi cotransporter family protein [Bacillota bacterium]
MNIYDVFHLLGGLAMFLYGMHVMGDALEKKAGKRLKPILEQLTSTPVKGVVLGAGVTAVVQSSSATTVMIVGFVNSGIMMLRQAIPVIMGANIGTTITAWVLSLTGIRADTFLLTLLKPSTFSPLIAFAGIIMLMASRKKKDTASIMLGFAILMFGMDQMSDAVSGLAKMPEFRQMLLLFSNPVFGVLAGALVTAIIQSSSASVGILQAISNTGALSYGAALPIIMGQNIGTCVTSVISAIGANRNAKRVAAVHLSFNIIGTILFLTVFYLLDWIIGFSFTSNAISAFQIAVVHTVFNVTVTLVLFPFIKQLEWLAHKVVSDKKGNEKLELLDTRLLNTPAIAISRCSQLTQEMAAFAKEAFDLSLSLLDKYDEKVAQQVEELEQKIDHYEDRLGEYLVKVSAENMSQQESRDVSKLLRCIGDFERISDHALNISEVAFELDTKSIKFSDEAVKETGTMRTAVSEILGLTVEVFSGNDVDLARKVEPLEEVVDKLRTNIKANHVERLRTGACTIELGFVLSDLLTNLERVSDHCSNIAANVIEMELSGTLMTHEQMRDIHKSQAGTEYQSLYESYLQKYDLACSMAKPDESET